MSRLRRGAALGLALLAVAALAAPAAFAGVRVSGLDASHYPTIRGTIFSTAGPGLTPSLTEDGVPVAGFYALNLASSKNVVLAIDRSYSMHGKSFADAKAAARGFIAAKPDSDRIAVVAFGSGVTGLARFSAESAEADGALRALSIDMTQGTALYDAVAYSARTLAGAPGGRVLILLTDGTDTTSKVSLQAAAEAARAQNVLVYPIAIAGPSYDPTPLQQLAEMTGGTFHQATSSTALADVYASIARALRNTWRVSYATAARPGEQIKLQAAAAGAGSASTSYRIPASLGATRAPAPSHLVPEGAYGFGGPLAIGLAVGALTLLALVLVLAAYRGSWVVNRIAPHVGEASPTSKKRRGNRFAWLQTVFGATEKTFGHLKQWRWTQRMLERADLPLRTVEFFWIMVGAAFFLAFFAIVAKQPPMVILLFMAAGAAAPFLFVWLKMRKRLRAFEDQLPDILITIAASLKAGHSFKQGLQAVVDEGQPPASDEFKRVLTETSLGRPMDEGLADMAMRCGSKNFEFAITAVTIQRQVGGSLASLFDMVADTVRQRQQFARKIRSLTAMGRMSAYTLMGVPFFMAATITMINPTYMHPLYATHTGHLLIIMGLTMMVVGSAILKKIVSFRG